MCILGREMKKNGSALCNIEKNAWASDHGRTFWAVRVGSPQVVSEPGSGSAPFRADLFRIESLSRSYLFRIDLLRTKLLVRIKD